MRRSIAAAFVRSERVLAGLRGSGNIRLVRGAFAPSHLHRNPPAFFLRPMSKPAPLKIPAYAYDGDSERCGKRVRLYSLAAAEHLCFTSRAIARRNRRGALVAIQFRNEIGGNPMLRTLKAGQKYSVIERVSDDARAWTLTGVSGVRADYQIVVSDVSTDGRRNESSLLVAVHQDLPVVPGGSGGRVRGRHLAHAPGNCAAKPLGSGLALERAY